MTLRLFRWYDKLIVAKDERDVRKVLREISYTSQEARQGEVKRVRRSLLLEFDGGDKVRLYTPSKAAKVCGRGIIPNG